MITERQHRAIMKQRDRWRTDAETLAARLEQTQHERNSAEYVAAGLTQALAAAVARAAEAETRAEAAERQLAHVYRAVDCYPWAGRSELAPDDLPEEGCAP